MSMGFGAGEHKDRVEEGGGEGRWGDGGVSGRGGLNDLGCEAAGDMAHEARSSGSEGTDTHEGRVGGLGGWGMKPRGGKEGGGVEAEAWEGGDVCGEDGGGRVLWGKPRWPRELEAQECSKEGAAERDSMKRVLAEGPAREALEALDGAGGPGGGGEGVEAPPTQPEALAGGGAGDTRCALERAVVEAGAAGGGARLTPRVSEGNPSIPSEKTEGKVTSQGYRRTLTGGLRMSLSGERELGSGKGPVGINPGGKEGGEKGGLSTSIGSPPITFKTHNCELAQSTNPGKSLASVFGTDGRRWDGQGGGQSAEQGRSSAHAARTGPVLGAGRSQNSRWRTGCSELDSRCSTGPVLGGQTSRCSTGVVGGAEGGWQKLPPRPGAPSVYGGVSYLCEGGRFGVNTRSAPSLEADSMGQGGVYRLGTHGSEEGGGVGRPPVPERVDRQRRLAGGGLHVAEFVALPCTAVPPPLHSSRRASGDSASDPPPPRPMFRAVTMTGRGGTGACRAALEAPLGLLHRRICESLVAVSHAPPPAHCPNFGKLCLRLRLGSRGCAWGARSLRSARWAPLGVEVAPRERTPWGGAQERLGACVRLGVRQGGRATVSGSPSGEASNPGGGRLAAGLLPGIWGARIAPPEAGQCPPLPSLKLRELVRAALSWDVPKGGVFDTEPLGDMTVSSFGSEGLSSAALSCEGPDTTMRELEIPGGGPISGEKGSRLRETTAECSRRPGGSLVVSEERKEVTTGVATLPSKRADSEFARLLRQIQLRLSSSLAAGQAPVGVTATVQSDQRWPPSWSMKQLAAGRFLAHFASRMRARDWRGGSKVPAIWRPSINCQCGYGQNLAKPEEFEAQAERARNVLDWDRAQAHLLKRLESGRAPLVLDLFCCAGGVSEGFRRAGGTSFGVDLQEQPAYVARFGDRWFKLGSALDRQILRGLVRRLKPIGIWASPPCEASSTATFAGGFNSEAPRLIAQTRDLLIELGLPYIIENVRGAVSELSKDALTLKGQEFGLETERPRLFEAGNGLELKACAFLAEGGLDLRSRSCLGERARYSKLDSFGRRFSVPCCAGNIFPVMGSHPSKSSVEENARAMGLDPGHMPFARMAKAIPPVYAAYLFGFMVRHTLEQRYGVRALSWDEAQKDLPRARREMTHLLRGAGSSNPNQGVEFTKLSKKEVSSPVTAATTAPVTAQGARGSLRRDPGWGITRLAAREIELSYAGGCNAICSATNAWLDDLRPLTHVGAGDLGMEGGNSFILVHQDEIGEVGSALASAIRRDPLTRAVIVCLPEDEPKWRNTLRDSTRVTSLFQLGGDASVGGARAEDLLSNCQRAIVLAVNERSNLLKRGSFDRELVRTVMDPLDTGIENIPKSWKQAVSYSRYPPLREENWAGKGFPERIMSLIREGATIETYDEPEVQGARAHELSDPRADEPLGPGRFCDHRGVVHQFKMEDGQYAYPDREHFEQGVAECDRALLVGHLEPVPVELVDEALATAPAHPWTIVHQSSDKWRAAQDYSRSTNGRVGSRPFTLPSVWDAGGVVKDTSFFAKYDLRDGFWAVSVAKSSRPYVMVRHPASGRLLWCTSLPFGYKLSPLIFCDFTESVAQVYRARVAGKGIHIFVFVDDFLVVGDCRESTIEGMETLEALFDELGLQWALHKRRGPARAMEFLGFLLINLPEQGLQSVAITEGRQNRLRELIDSWWARRPCDIAESRGELAMAEPKELASLLGMLVFSSAAVTHGRTYMQGMLRQFANLEVDWKRGVVRFKAGSWSRLPLSSAFWRDLAWWRGALSAPCSVPLKQLQLGDAAITGTDASDYACGELAWIDGAREEMVSIFTRAEKRRPINLRELLGVYRLVERWGGRLKGRTFLIDIDNTPTVGAARAQFSKSEDMQELVRRLVELAELHDLRLRPVHTPGAMLHRPDQTSRGAAVEEPRVRMRQEIFRSLESLHGPFSEILGAEREFARRPDQNPGRARIWAHPTYDTVGSALGRIGERLDTRVSKCASGLVLVPWAPEAAWWPLLRHFTCVARFGVNSKHLEENRAGRWVPVSARRPSVVMSFPSHLGTVVPLDSLVPTIEEDKEKPENSPTILRGTLLYSPRSVPDTEGLGGGLHGCLYILLKDYDGSGDPECAELFRHRKGAGREGMLFHCDMGDSRRKGQSLDANRRPYRPYACQVWVANHFASEHRAQTHPSWNGLWKSVSFDFEAAEREIRMRRNALNQMTAEVGLANDELSEDLQVEIRHLLERGREADNDQPMSRLDARQEGSAEGEDSGGASPNRGSSDPEVSSHRTPVRLSITGQPLITSFYEGMKCAGCDRPFGKRTRRTRITPGGVGMIHNSRACLDKARIAMEEEVSALEREPVTLNELNGIVELGEGGAAATVCQPCEPPPRTGCDQYRQQIKASVSESRQARVFACLANTCGVEGEEPMICLGRIGGNPCPARLHGRKCVQLTKGHAGLGCFLCPDCRIRKLLPGTDPTTAPREAKEIAVSAMLVQMASGAEATGASYFDYQRLEREFMASFGSEGGILPSDDENVFIMFMCWVVLTKDRALSLDTLVRTAGAVMERTRGVNLTRKPAVKAVYEELRQRHGEESRPRTAVTSLMMRHLLETVIPERGGNERVNARAVLMFAIEIMFGVRVGEALSAGDFHGILANNLVLLQKLDANAQPMGEETAEVLLEHSKTKHKRYVNAVGVSKGKARVELAKHIREYWRLAGFSIRSRKEAGFLVTGPDYYVLRLSLVALTNSQEGDIEKITQVGRLLKRSASKEARQWADYSVLRGTQRLKADSLDKKYINLVGGFFGCDDIAQVALQMEQANLAQFISVVPGPLMRASHGKEMGYAHMPLQPSSTYQMLHECLPKAYDLANADGPDPDLDLRGLIEPLWGHHSIRRGADTMARNTMHITGATERDIDMIFGWNEHMYRAIMQLHYESNLQRDRRAKVTSMM